MVFVRTLSKVARQVLHDPGCGSQPMSIAVCTISVFPRQVISSANFHSVSFSETDQPKVLITGGLGQLGVGLSKLLRKRFGKNNVILSDIRNPPSHIFHSADSWPLNFDDSKARKDWGWKHDYDLPELAQTMLSLIGSGSQMAHAS